MLISQVMRKLPCIPLTCPPCVENKLHNKVNADTHLHRMREHPRQPERNLLRELLPVHRDLETVPKVDVHHLARVPHKHEIRRMTIAQTEDVPDHAVHRERSSVGRAAFEPVLRVYALEP